MNPGRSGALTALLLSALAACAPAEGEPEAPPAVERTAAAQPEEGGEVIRPGAPRLGPYAVLDSASVDLDRDGTAERVELSALVEVDARGRALWEDGHHWLVLVRDGETAYPLLEEFVPWGGAAFWVLEGEPADPPTLLVVTRSRMAEHAAIGVSTFRFDAARGGFLREGPVEAAGRVLHGDPSTLPVLVGDSLMPGEGG